MVASAKPEPGLNETDALVRRWARWILQRNLVAPAVVLLELCKPLSFLGSQLLWLLEPLWGRGAAVYARLFEDRANLERLLRAIASQETGPSAPDGRGDSCHL